MNWLRAFYWSVIAAVLALLMTIGLGYAHDPRTHLADDWSDAKSRSGMLCCHGQDYDVPYDWRNAENDGFAVQLVRGGEWLPAPAHTVVANKRANGEPKVWLTSDRKAVRCFMPGVQS